MDLKKLWDIELEITDAIADFCEKNGLKYSLAYGSMLGAVRHKGFIPWDDDIDIIMPREDYEKLLQEWNVPGFVLQNKRTNKDFNQNFTKIRKDNTTFIQYEWEKDVSYHTGIFVDIFPGDRVSKSKVAQKLQMMACALDLLFTRGFPSKGKTKIFEEVLLFLPEKVRLKMIPRLEKYISRWNSDKSNKYFFPSVISEVYKRYPEDLFSEMTLVEFADRQYQCVKDWDLMLRLDYGDYMTLPPEDERVLKHHPLVVDFERNWNLINNTNDGKD